MAFLNRERLTVYPRIFLVLYVLVGGYWILGGYLAGGGPVDRLGKPVGGDFVQYWAASRLVLAGDAVSVYDPAKFYAAERQVAGVSYLVPWLYPPMFLLILTPLALLPYLMSLCAWLGVTLTGYLKTLNRIAPHHTAFWLSLAFPGTFQNLIHGQNGFLSAGLLGGGLLLVDGNPWWAGVLLGLLIYKPHLALLVPLALAAGRCWKALAAMLITAGALALISTLTLGTQVWLSFWHNIPFAMQLIQDGSIPIYKMPTVFAAILQAGGGMLLAQVSQGVVTLGMIVAVFLSWRRKAALPIRASVLALGALLATPYAFEYDLAILALPLAWLGWEIYRKGWLPLEEPVLILAWLLPLATTKLAQYTGCQVGPLVLLALLAVAWRRGSTAPAALAPVSREGSGSR